MEQYIKELETRIATLEDALAKLNNTAEIPWEFEQALRDRLVLGTNIVAGASSKTANSEDVTVNESGSGSYAVMNDPIGFIKLRFGENDYHIPYFNA
jgi:hypothetical protein